MKKEELLVEIFRGKMKYINRITHLIIIFCCTLAIYSFNTWDPLSKMLFKESLLYRYYAKDDISRLSKEINYADSDKETKLNVKDYVMHSEINYELRSKIDKYAEAVYSKANAEKTDYSGMFYEVAIPELGTKVSNAFFPILLIAIISTLLGIIAIILFSILNVHLKKASPYWTGGIADQLKTSYDLEFCIKSRFKRFGLYISTLLSFLIVYIVNIHALVFGSKSNAELFYPEIFQYFKKIFIFFLIFVALATVSAIIIERLNYWMEESFKQPKHLTPIS